MRKLSILSLLLIATIISHAAEINFRVVVMNKMNRDPLPGAKVTLQETFSLRTFSAVANDSGIAVFQVDPTQRYRLDVSKDATGSSIAFMGYSYMLSDKDFATGKDFDVELERIKRNDFGLITATVFEYKRGDLTADNKTSLDNAVAMLKQFPTLKMEIGVHADCRETESFTAQRAESISRYMTEKGVIKQVVVKKFYNTKPLNSCDCTSTLVSCNDEKYAENRRAEFKILSF